MTQIGSIRLLSQEPSYSSSHANIYQAEHTIYGRIIAKVFYFSNYEDLSIKLREAFIQAKLHHPNICSAYDLVLNKHGKQKELILCVEQLDHNLQEEIITHEKANRRYSEDELIKFLTEMTDALAEAQQLNICHRDIKPSNVFMTADGEYKIGDFGEAKFVITKTDSNTLCGTPPYMSPLLKAAQTNMKWKTTHNPFRSDVFSLGLTALSMAMLHVFTARESIDSQIRETIIDGLGYSDRLKSLLKEMLREEEDVRPDFPQLKSKIEESYQKEKSNSFEGIDGLDLGYLRDILGLSDTNAKTLERVPTHSGNSPTVVETVTDSPRKTSGNLRLYVKKCEIIEAISSSPSYAFASKVNEYPFEYIPTSYFQSNRQPESPTKLVIERMCDSGSYHEIQTIHGHCATYYHTSSDTTLQFTVRKDHKTITIAEPTIRVPILISRLTTNTPYYLSKHLVIRFPNTMMVVHDINDVQIVLQCTLSISSDAAKSYYFPCEKSQITIGRNASNDISIQDPGLSGMHAVIEYHNRVWNIKDCNSRNGTWVYCHTNDTIGRESNERFVEEEVQWINEKYRFKLVEMV